MKKLFDSTYTYTKEATDIEDAVVSSIQEVFDNYTLKGYSPREISHIIQSLTMDIECAIILELRSKQ